jgi:hypothetical protein
MYAGRWERFTGKREPANWTLATPGRLAYVLTGIGKLIEVELIEQRLAELERKLLK